MQTHLLFISGGEVFIVLVVALVLFGANKLPEMAKTLGKGVREFRRATDEIKREITDNGIVKDVNDISKDIKNNIS